MAKHDPSVTFDRIRDGLVNLFKLDPSDITLASTWDDLGLDSLDFFELTMMLEDEFQIALDDKKFASLSDLSEVVTYVDALASQERANG